MIIKPTAVIDYLCTEMFFACGVVEAAFSRTSYKAVVTCGRDSHDNKPLSLHHKGLALDYRIKQVPIEMRKDLVERINGILNPLGFDVLHESIGTENEHIHIEWDPKGTESIFVKET